MKKTPQTGGTFHSEHKQVWRAKYYTEAERFLCKLKVGDKFTGEDIRIAVEPITGKPPHHNVWGAIFHSILSRWESEGRVKPTAETRYSTLPSRRHNIVRVYLMVSLEPNVE